MSDRLKTSTNLNIRIDKELKNRLDEFARNNRVPTTTLVLSQIRMLLDSGTIAPDVIRLATESERSRVQQEVDM